MRINMEKNRATFLTCNNTFSLPDNKQKKQKTKQNQKKAIDREKYFFLFVCLYLYHVHKQIDTEIFFSGFHYTIFLSDMTLNNNNEYCATQTGPWTKNVVALNKATKSTLILRVG